LQETGGRPKGVAFTEIKHDGSDKEIVGGVNWELPSSIQSHCSSFSHLTLLQILHIGNHCNLQSLSELTLPSSFSQLIIYDCPDLQSLPVKGVPSSLSELWIFRCPLLSPLLEFQKGEYWPNIAQIPFIFVDGKHL